MKERANPLLKRLDFYLGVPLVFLLSRFRRRHARPSEIREIAGLKSAAIGDTVLVSALIRDLKQHFPQARVTLLTGTSNAAAARLFAQADQVVALPMSRPWQALRILRRQRFDVFIDFDSWPRINALLALFSRSRFRVGFRTPGQGRHWGYDLSVAHRADQHEIENYRDLIRPFGVREFHEPVLQAPPTGSSGPDRRILIHPWPGGSRAREKLWPLPNWVALARRLKSEGRRVLISTGPSDVENSQKLRSLAPELFEICRPSSLESLLQALRDCEAVVSVDTGVAHLAGALGQNTLVLYGPTSPKRWGALGPRVKWLKDTQPAGISLGFEPVTSTAAAPGVQLEPELVVTALLEMLRESEGPSVT